MRQNPFLRYLFLAPATLFSISICTLSPLVIHEEKDPIQEYNVLQSQPVLDLTKLKPADVSESKNAKDFLRPSPEQTILPTTYSSWCIPCPFAGYPEGCNCYVGK